MTRSTDAPDRSVSGFGVPLGSPARRAGARRSGKWLVRFVAWGCRAVAAVSLLFFLSGLTLRFTPVGTRVAEYLMAATPLDQLPQADAIVVLGGDPLRSADALRIYRAGKAPMIILSGEAEEALSILDAGMVPRCVVRLDTAPRRTMDHPRTILSVGGIDHSSRLILVSSKLHQRRALAIFRQAGYNDVWMTSIETELHYARKKRQPNHIEVACVFYEVAARVKSWLVD